MEMGWKERVMDRGTDDKRVTFLCVYLSYGANAQNHDNTSYTFQISK